MSENEKMTDSIPRLPLSHLFDTLGLLALQSKEISFEHVRSFLHGKSQRNLPSTPESMWSATRDALIELQRLNLANVGPIPRKRSDVSRLRETPVIITPRGKELASLAKKQPGRAYDEMLLLWMNEHLYFRSFIKRLANRPMHIPDITSLKQLGAEKQRPQSRKALCDAIVSSSVGRLSKVGYNQDFTDKLCELIGIRLEKLDETVILGDLDVKRWIDAIQDGVILPAYLEVEGLGFDPVTFQHILKAGQDFFASSWTSSHPDFDGRVVYGTCDFEPDILSIGQEKFISVKHHSVPYADEGFKQEFIKAYHLLAGPVAGYVNAYQLRALVCVGIRIQPQVFAVCLTNVINEGEGSKPKVYTELPFSSPPPGESYIEVSRHRIGSIKLGF